MTSWLLFMLQGPPVSGPIGLRTQVAHDNQRPLQYDSSSVLWWPKHGSAGSWAPGLKITTVMKEKEGPAYQGLFLGGWVPAAVLLARWNGCPLDAGSCRGFTPLFIQCLVQVVRLPDILEKNEQNSWLDETQTNKSPILFPMTSVSLMSCSVSP